MPMSNTSLTTSSVTSAAIRPRAPWRDWLALSLLMFPVLLVAVDNTALTFALPAIARSLDASGVQLLWIVDAYPLVLAGLLVAMGSLGDRIGRRRLLFIGSTGFAAVSAVTAFAPDAYAFMVEHLSGGDPKTANRVSERRRAIVAVTPEQRQAERRRRDIEDDLRRLGWATARAS